MTCTITETASSTNNPPITASTISCLVATAIVPNMPPSASDPVSPMKIEAGGALNQRKPKPGADHRAAQHRELAGAGDVMDLQVIGEHRVADQIRDAEEGGAAIITGTMASPSRPSVRFTALPAPTMMKAPNSTKNQPRLMINSLNIGNVSEVAKVGRPSWASDKQAPMATIASAIRRARSGAAAVGLPRDLQIVVVEADQAETERHAEHDPDIGIERIGPQHRRDHQSGKDHQPAHGGRALLGDEMRLRAVGADRLALALLQTQGSMIGEPTKNTNTMAVIIAPPVRKVM